MEKELEKVLRPQAFEQFSGQPQIIENLNVFIKAAKQRDEALDHVLLHGPPGLGKATLACLMDDGFDAEFIALFAVF